MKLAIIRNQIEWRIIPRRFVLAIDDDDDYDD